MNKVSHKVVIVAWDEVAENVSDIYNELSDFSPVIINSTSNRIFENQVKVPNIFYNQISTAFGLVKDDDYLTYISGDVSTENWPTYLNRVIDVCDRFQPYVYSPYITYEGYPSEFVSLSNLKCDKSIDLAVMTDGIQFSLNSEIVQSMSEFIDFIRSSSSYEFSVGWGLDWAWNLLALVSDKPILRDSFIKVLHPRSTSYSRDTAKKEFDIIIELLMRFFEYKYGSKIKINKLLYAVSERIKLNSNFANPRKFYSDELLAKFV